MHNALARVQAVFGYFTSCAFALAGIVALLSVIPFPPPRELPSAAITLRDVKVVKGRPHYYSPKKEEYSQIRFDLDADLSSLFTWNTKQLFVYVTANYPSASDAEGSESVVWDLIIPATATPYSIQTLKQQYFPDKKKSKRKQQSSTEVSKPGVISLKNQKSKYQITDPSGKLAGTQNVTLQVSWNIQPWVGALVWDKGFFGGRVGKWRVGQSGRSDAFEFPQIKSSSSNVVKDEKGPRTPKAGSAAPVVDI